MICVCISVRVGGLSEFNATATRIRVIKSATLGRKIDIEAGKEWDVR